MLGKFEFSNIGPDNLLSKIHILLSLAKRLTAKYLNSYKNTKKNISPDVNMSIRYLEVGKMKSNDLCFKTSRKSSKL